MFNSLTRRVVIVCRLKFAFIAILTIFLSPIGVYGGKASDSWRLFARETNGMFEKCAQSVSHSKQMEPFLASRQILKKKMHIKVFLRKYMNKIEWCGFFPRADAEQRHDK